MKLFDLLDEIKIGDEEFRELKLAEDIESDIDTLEEGTRYIRINRRLNKLHDRLSGKAGDIKELNKIIRDIGKTSNVFESVDNMFWAGRTPTQAQAKVKMISIKKNFERMINELRERNVQRMITEMGAQVLMGEAIGSIIYGANKLQKIAKTTAATSLQKRLVPVYLKYESNLEQKLLKKAEDGGFEPEIREDFIEE